MSRPAVPHKAIHPQPPPETLRHHTDAQAAAGLATGVSETFAMRSDNSTPSRPNCNLAVAVRFEPESVPHDAGCGPMPTITRGVSGPCSSRAKISSGKTRTPSAEPTLQCRRLAIGNFRREHGRRAGIAIVLQSGEHAGHGRVSSRWPHHLPILVTPAPGASTQGRRLATGPDPSVCTDPTGAALFLDA